MPCSDGRPCFQELMRRSQVISEISKLEKKRDELTEMLCSTCRVLERVKFDFDENPQLSKWWDKHKREDEKREAEEIKKRLEKQMALELTKKSLSELTIADKKLLKRFGYL